MRGLALVLAACACLSGCEGPSVFAPVPQKVRAAFPLPDEVELAHARLVASLDGDRQAQDAVARQFEQLVTARALACTAANPVGPFDSVAAIRQRPADKACFTRHDAQLGDWIAVRRIGLALREPPLVPAAALPARALLPNTTGGIASVHLAAQANVLVLRNHQQRFHALEVPTGKELASFSTSDSYGRTPSLSPNGRLLAVGGGRTLRFFEVETGRALWSTDKYVDVLAWAPQWDMVVLTLAGTGAPQMLDTQSGTVEPYPSSEKRLTWSLPAGEGELLVGNHSSASLMRHLRPAGGPLHAQPVRQWPLTNRGVAGGAPFLMNQGGKLVFPNNRDLAWLDLSTGQQGAWQLSALGASSYAQVGDTLIAFDTMPTGTSPGATRLFDTEKGTIADARDAADRGQLFALPPRPGFLRHSANALTLAGAMEGEEPQDAERLIADALVAREIAKLNDPYRHDSCWCSPATKPSAGRSSPEAARSQPCCSPATPRRR